MLSLNALSCTAQVKDWLASSYQPRILHVFERACNLTNERKEVLSIVTSQVGNGPFNLVIKEDICFSGHLNIKSPISISQAQLQLEGLNINTTDGRLWSPRPDWGSLHNHRETVIDRIRSLRARLSEAKAQQNNPPAITSITDYQSLISNLSSTLAKKETFSAITLASQLAGLGAGLTPAGDDYILGAVFALQIIYPAKIASKLAREITDIAAPLTTSLSAAWLRSAGRGEAGILWHDFFEALISADPSEIELRTENLLSVGHTSGADALSGFIGTLACWTQSAIS